MSPRFLSISLAPIFLAVFAAPRADAQCPGWSQDFSLPGTDRSINALCTYDDGSGPVLIAGGAFTVAGGKPCLRVAEWRGGQWSAMGSGIGDSESDHVDALAVYDDGHGPKIYAGGSFDITNGYTIDGLAAWDGVSWSPVQGNYDPVTALAVFDDGTGPALHVLAGYTIRKWNGSSWSTVGTFPHPPYASPRCMAVHDDGTGPALYVAGWITDIDGVRVSGIARWNGRRWSAVGPLESNVGISSLAVFDDGSGPKLYATATFGPNSITRSAIERWDGTSWTTVGPTIDSVWLGPMGVFRDADGPALFVAEAEQQTDARDLLRWDGKHLSRMHTEFVGGPVALLSFGSGSDAALYVAGGMSRIGGVAVGNIARLNGVTWSALDASAGAGGPDAEVDALAIFDDGSGPALYAAGVFVASAGGVEASAVARWNGSAWSSVAGLSLYDHVTALIGFDDGSGPALYAGGTQVWRWNGKQWSEVGQPMLAFPFAVDAFAVYDDGHGPALYAGGEMNMGYSYPIAQVAKWDGAAWIPIAGSGAYYPSPVTCLAVFDAGAGPELYAGCDTLSTLPGSGMATLAKWNGSSWSGVGPQLIGQVHAMTTFDDGSGLALYVGGELSGTFGAFNSLDGVARWSGAHWSAVTPTTTDALHDSVMSLSVFDDGTGPALYAGGQFLRSQTALAPGNFAKWAGTGWVCASAGLNLPVHAMLAGDIGAGSQLFIGGEFTTAGRNASSHVAAYSGCR